MRNILPFLQKNKFDVEYFMKGDFVKLENKAGVYILTHTFFRDREQKIVHPLYVGSSSEIRTRIHAHPQKENCFQYADKKYKDNNQSTVIAYIKYIDDFKLNEIALIKLLQPVFNKQHR